MQTSIEVFEKWLKEPEKGNLEFKAAKASFDKKKDLPEYCAAIANSGGGRLILGVDDSGRVTGSDAFRETLHALPHEIFQQINHHVDIEELSHPSGRVVIFHIPARPRGFAIVFRGKYLMRRGSSLVDMDPLTLRNVFSEIEPDFSAEPVSGLKLEDLDEKALETLRSRWAAKAKRPDLNEITFQQTLQDLELAGSKGITYAALLLVGKAQVITQYLPDAEIIFEWRLDSNKISHDARKEWRAPYLLVADQVWQEIESRNQRFPFQEGFFQREVFAFDEKSVREAVNNAVAHRDYRLPGRSIFIKVNPEEFIIQNPGSFPPGVTRENILNVTVPRNRRLAETMNKIGLVERSGQGLNDIFRKTIQDGKGLPQIREEGGYWVNLYIPAQVKDIQFLRYLEKVVNEKQIGLSLEELMALENIRVGQSVPPTEFKGKFLQYGLIEKVGLRGRGVRYVLSHAYYASANQKGEYTRRVGLGREEQKQLIIKHLRKNGQGTIQEFMQILSQLSRATIAALLRSLKEEGVVCFEGKRKTGVWRLTKPSSKV